MSKRAEIEIEEVAVDYQDIGDEDFDANEQNRYYYY